MVDEVTASVVRVFKLAFCLIGKPSASILPSKRPCRCRATTISAVINAAIHRKRILLRRVEVYSLLFDMFFSSCGEILASFAVLWQRFVANLVYTTTRPCETKSKINIGSSKLEPVPALDPPRRQYCGIFFCAVVLKSERISNQSVSSSKYCSRKNNRNNAIIAPLALSIPAWSKSLTMVLFPSSTKFSRNAWSTSPFSFGERL
ncbi:hypothetical protein SAMN02745220_04042 [Desulfopila aestuarii DSM 18488]|uniref:Uncharacterized protein n=1 Tax=Desulfopila aestuarii DSM 18488 TaxID=1121416 RepID=A0A1M7YFT6_9BACT|nr:hypothetical protein SAMN02745220_04042 [Desulfopila aestuarii DSM 18488]